MGVTSNLCSVGNILDSTKGGEMEACRSNQCIFKVSLYVRTDDEWQYSL